MSPPHLPKQTYMFVVLNDDTLLALLPLSNLRCESVPIEISNHPLVWCLKILVRTLTDDSLCFLDRQWHIFFTEVFDVHYLYNSLMIILSSRNKHKITDFDAVIVRQIIITLVSIIKSNAAENVFRFVAFCLAVNRWMIAGLETPNSGDIYIDGQRVNDVPAAKRGIGFVFQNYALFRYMTVYDNVAFGLELAKVPKKEIKKRVTELLELTGLSGMEKRYPNQLSGGQRQRVAFARALAPNPQVLLLDEPFAAIDAKVRTELRNWLREMVVKLGITSIFVTHDRSMVSFYVRRVR